MAPAGMILVSFILAIHSVDSQIISSENIQQGKGAIDVSIESRMIKEGDEQYSYLTGTDLMADESLSSERYNYSNITLQSHYFLIHEYRRFMLRNIYLNL